MTNKNYLEPTYLRYVYDALNKGSLNSENSAALPRGFIGLLNKANVFSLFKDDSFHFISKQDKLTELS